MDSYATIIEDMRCDPSNLKLCAESRYDGMGIGMSGATTAGLLLEWEYIYATYSDDGAKKAKISWLGLPGNVKNVVRTLNAA